MYNLIHQRNDQFAIRIKPRKATISVSFGIHQPIKQQFFLQFPYTYVFSTFKTISNKYYNQINPIVAFSDQPLNQFDYFHKDMYILPIPNVFDYGGVCLGKFDARSIKNLAEKSIEYFFNKTFTSGYYAVLDKYINPYRINNKLNDKQIFNQWHQSTLLPFKKIYTNEIEINRGLIKKYMTQ